MEQKELLSDPQEKKQRHTLSALIVFLGWVGMIIFALHASTHMVGAGDTWVAMACGRHFLNHGVDTVEPFSANSHKAGPTEKEIEEWPDWAKWVTKKVGIDTVRYWHPTGWINQNWLTHVLFYWLTHESPVADARQRSFNTLVYWKFALYIVTIICVYYAARLMGVDAALAAVFACFALFIGRSFFDIRPAGFSNLLVAVYFLALVLATYRNILYLWLIVPAVAFWCNLHGGYIYAFIMLVPFFFLHLLIMLPRRWTACIHAILMWLALYGFAYRILAHDNLVPVGPAHDKLLMLLFLLAVAGIVITAIDKVKDKVAYGYHILISVIVFFAVLARLFPEDLGRYNTEVIKYVRNARPSFVLAFVAISALGVLLTVLKNRLVGIGLKGLCHTAAVGIVAFAASVILNPFHLTNLTHTFVISVSRHAEKWRTVNEWHPGFEWSNAVGTGFPFLVLVMMCFGLTAFWLTSRFFKPTLLKGSRTQLEHQHQRFSLLSKIFGLTMAVFLVWTAFVSLRQLLLLHNLCTHNPACRIQKHPLYISADTPDSTGDARRPGPERIPRKVYLFLRPAANLRDHIYPGVPVLRKIQIQSHQHSLCCTHRRRLAGPCQRYIQSL